MPFLPEESLIKTKLFGVSLKISDIGRQQKTQSGICNMAHGMAAALDVAMSHRTQRLRLLGNAVVPAQAAAALRVLLSRL